VASLRSANEAAAKSLAARATGAQQSVTTAVPDRSRLVPPSAHRAEPTWCCDKCQHLNTGNREACTRCRCANPGHVRAPPPGRDPLTCGDDEVVRLACEKNHPSLNRAFLEAGTPMTSSGVGGTAASIREALRSRGHERLMRLVYVLTAKTGCAALLAASRDLRGNHAVQHVIQASLKLRAQAVLMRREGAAPSEDFASVPAGAATAATAYNTLMRALAAHSRVLAVDACGIYVLLGVVNTSPAQDLAPLAAQMAAEFHEYGFVKEACHYVTTMVKKLCEFTYEGSPAGAAAAAGALTALLAAYRRNFRTLCTHAKNAYLGEALARAIEATLPRPDAFKVGHQLAGAAAHLAGSANGIGTLERLVLIRPADALRRRMVRDLAAYVALALAGSLGDVAGKGEGGASFVRHLLLVLADEREDEWVQAITSGARPPHRVACVRVCVLCPVGLCAFVAWRAFLRRGRHAWFWPNRGRNTRRTQKKIPKN
jgi:hypothetical protein